MSDRSDLPAAEMVRVIKEEEPSKPSTKLSTDASAPSLAALRHTEPRKLAALLRGELDCVVMKCLDFLKLVLKPAKRFILGAVQGTLGGGYLIECFSFSGAVLLFIKPWQTDGYPA